MSEADKRVSELLDRWLASLDLHTRYLKLDDAEYAKVQPWPKHQRPNKWIIDLARQRVDELRFHLKERREIGDLAHFVLSRPETTKLCLGPSSSDS